MELGDSGKVSELFYIYVREQADQAKAADVLGWKQHQFCSGIE